MSLARQFFRDMRPFFRMLEEPLGRPPTYFGGTPSLFRPPDLENFMSRPAVDVSDQGNRYVVEADLPGVPKENVEVRIGDNGRSVTIEGKVVEGPGAGSTATEHAEIAPQGQASTDSTAVAKTEPATQLTAERPYTRNVSFTRTVWLPRPVDAEDVSARMENGVLKISVKKAEDKQSTVIRISE